MYGIDGIGHLLQEAHHILLEIGAGQFYLLLLAWRSCLSLASEDASALHNEDRYRRLWANYG